ncbi:MAG TPA: hypothetical protein VN676_01665 [Steroidobacteraceae bacterium]|nr:hypothetical protein [Steroidobacteraceae bacterium]
MNTPAQRLTLAAALIASFLMFTVPARGQAQDAAPEVGPTHAPLPAPTAPATPPAAPAAPVAAAPGEPGKPAFGMPDPSAPLRYDTEYPPMHYEGLAQNNRIARLQARLERGEVKLDFEPGHGYLRSLLKALDIDPSSQVLVYSKTSLQTGEIQAASPRALYFNEDTYVGWVQGAQQIELGTMDSTLDQVFYTLKNGSPVPAHFKRETTSCLGCHDSLSYSGGGVPRFLLMSTYVNTHGDALTHEGSILVTDHTEFRYRWGGWYVTGQQGSEVHLGNVLVHDVKELINLDSVRRGNLDNLDALFDTKPYLTDKSDIVALQVLLHQSTVQDRITEVNWDTRTALAKAGKDPADGRGVTLPPQSRKQIKDEMDALVDEMLFVGDPGYKSKLTGNSGFDKWFQARGPRDSHGRSLRELDLTTRLFKYPCSFLIYSDAFNALPLYAKDYLYARLVRILTGKEHASQYAALSEAGRKAAVEILKATLPQFAAALKKG